MGINSVANNESLRCCIPGCHVSMALTTGVIGGPIYDAGKLKTPEVQKATLGFGGANITNICCRHIPGQICTYWACISGIDKWDNNGIFSGLDRYEITTGCDDGNGGTVNCIWSHKSFHKGVVGCANPSNYEELDEIGADYETSGYRLSPEYTGGLGVCNGRAPVDYDLLFGQSGGICYALMDDFFGLVHTGMYERQVPLTGLQKNFFCHKCDIFCTSGAQSGCYSGDPYVEISGRAFINPCAMIWTVDSGDAGTYFSCARAGSGCPTETGVIWTLPKKNISLTRQDLCCSCRGNTYSSGNAISEGISFIDNHLETGVYDECKPPCSQKPVDPGNLYEPPANDILCHCVPERLCAIIYYQEDACLYGNIRLNHDDWYYHLDTGLQFVTNIKLDPNGNPEPGSNCHPDNPRSGVGGDMPVEDLRFWIDGSTGNDGCICQFNVGWANTANNDLYQIDSITTFFDPGPPPTCTVSGNPELKKYETFPVGSGNLDAGSCPDFNVLATFVDSGHLRNIDCDSGLGATPTDYDLVEVEVFTRECAPCGWEASTQPCCTGADKFVPNILYMNWECGTGSCSGCHTGDINIVLTKYVDADGVECWSHRQDQEDCQGEVMSLDLCCSDPDWVVTVNTYSTCPVNTVAQSIGGTCDPFLLTGCVTFDGESLLNCCGNEEDPPPGNLTCCFTITE